jgi:hypothetical protein
VISRAEQCRNRAADCEGPALLAKDPDTKSSFAEVARQWWDLARQIELIERDLSTLTVSLPADPIAI